MTTASKQRVWYAANRAKCVNYSRRYRETHKEELKKRRRIAYVFRQEEIKEARRRYRAAYPKKIKEASRRYFAKHKSQRAAQRREKSRTDVSFRLRGTIATRIRDVLKGRRKASSTLNLLGESIAFVRGHLEAQFQAGMSWNNYGEWHIDHIRPCASFDLSDPVQQKICFHYSNLQPLWALDNFKKGAKC